MSCPSFFKNMKRLLLSLDIFGSEINLQIKKENEYHTGFGIIISLAILSLVYYSFLSLVIDMIERKSPNVLQNIQYQPNPEEHILKDDEFFFLILLTNNYGVPILQKPNQLIYQSQLSVCSRQTDVNNSISNTCTNFTLKQCSQLQLNKDIQYKLNISQVKLETGVCLDPKDWSIFNISLQGTPQSATFKSLQFTIEKCNNLTSNGNCAPIEEINKKLSFVYVGIFLTDYLLNQQKQQNPFTVVTKLIQTTLSSSNYKSLTQIMRISKLYNKENFFYYFENQQEYRALLIDKQTEQTFNVPSSKLIDIVMYLDDREALYYRNYNNILDILGQIGGLFELLSFLLGLIVKPINKISCDLFLASEIFQIEKQKQQSRVAPSISQNEIKIMQQANLKQNEISVLRKFFKLKANQVKIYFYHLFCTCGNDRKIIQNSIEQIYSKIDILFIINKLIEIDKLKKIILNEDQQILFNYIHRPKIALGEQIDMKKSTIKNCYDNSQLTFDQEIQKALQSYQTIKQSENKKNKKINENLLNLLDKDIKYLLDFQESSQKIQIDPFQQNQVNSINDLSLVENRIDI